MTSDPSLVLPRLSALRAPPNFDTGWQSLECRKRNAVLGKRVRHKSTSHALLFCHIGKALNNGVELC